LIQQPSATRRSEALGDWRERHFAPIIMVPRHAIDRRLDACKKFESFGQVLSFFDQVAGEANEIRRECIYFLTTVT